MDTGRKIYLVFAVIVCLLFLVIIGRFYYLQVVLHEDRMQKIESSVEFTTVSGKRGTIYDRNGTPLAMSEPKVDIAVDPQGISDKAFMADIISGAIDVNRDEVLEILNKKGHFKYLRKDASYDEVASLKSAVKEAKSREDKKARASKHKLLRYSRN